MHRRFVVKVAVELDEADMVLVGHTLRSLAHTRLADASAAERLERRLVHELYLIPRLQILIVKKPPCRSFFSGQD